MSLLLPEFQRAFPHLGQDEALQAHLLPPAWSASLPKLRGAIEACHDVMPLMLHTGTNVRANATLVKTTADGALWSVLQHFSIGALSLTMVAFFDFAATEQIDPEAITALIGSAPKAE